MESNSTRLIHDTDNTVVDVDADGIVPLLQEEEDDEIGLAEIPLASSLRRSKRQRPRSSHDSEDDSPDDHDAGSAIEIGSDTDAPPQKRQRGQPDSDEGSQDGDDDKKKLAMDVSYEGFAIYGRVLCLVVKKRESGKTRQPSSSAAAAPGSAGGKLEGQAMMENWITSTQIPVGEED